MTLPPVPAPPDDPPGYTALYGPPVPKPTPALHPPGGVAFMRLGAAGIRTVPDVQPKPIRDDRLRGYDDFPHPYKNYPGHAPLWRYYAALWIVVDVAALLAAVVYALSHGAKPF